MSDAAKSEMHPFERFREAMKQLLTVSKKEILRREAEHREQSKGGKHGGKEA
jgi:hypothetical protein